MEEKEWSEPELIVLVRSKPEEDVLAGCKVFTETNYGASRIYATCSITACLTQYASIADS
jgi:hypothetical protein